MTVVDLEKYRTLGSKVFTGRDRGVEVRNASCIDALSSKAGQITIIIPDDIRSINPSFLEEFLFNAVRNLGEKGFAEKFKFKNNGRYQIAEDLKEAIERILRDENALA